MGSRFDRVVPFGKQVLDEFRTENVTFMAGSIAYQAFVSLLPLLVLVLLAVSTVGDEQVAAQVTSLTQSFLPRAARTLLGNALDGSTGSTGVSVIGVVTLLWGSLKIFRGLDTAFSDIYDTEAENSFVDQLVDGLVVFVTVGLAIAAAGVATTVFALFEWIPFIGVLSPLLLVISLTIAFFPIYYLFPDMDVSPRETLPGVAVAAVGWTLLQALFQVYVSFSSKTSAYGILGAILLLLTWLYFAGLVLLLGAVVNAVIAGRTGDRATGSPDERPAATDDARSTQEGPETGDGGRRVRNEIRRASFAEILRDVGHEFDGDGEAIVSLGTDTVTLHPPSTVDVSIEASAPEGDREDDADESLTISARWRTTDRPADGE